MTRWALCISTAFLALVLALSGTRADAAGVAGDSRAASETAPVPSLDPEGTANLWRRLVDTRARRSRAEAGCRPVRAVFYAATDFLRLATKLAASASPCAQYYVSIPGIVGNRTQPRRDQAWRIRALGANFHAMAEIHYTAWTNWVASTGSSWYAAGVTARERMAEAGYDVIKGDTWVVNEVSSAVRRGIGNARANLRELLRGLYEGDGTHPTRGAALVIGVGQQASDLSLYQTNLQNWFSDSAFWTDMGTYVSDWSQEVYGDLRSYAVPGAPLALRRDYLNDYLQHELVLAGAGPSTIETARSFLQTAYSPLANAAWERESGYGWTMVPAEQMAAYVSAQTYALRYFSATTGQAQDHWGFAWAPRNASGASAVDFAARTGLILDRLGAAIRDSADSVNPSDPGSAACGAGGVSCAGDVAGARFNEAWKTFRTWTQPVLTFATPAQTIAAGTPSAAMTVALTTSSGQAATTSTPLAVTLSSSSPRGTFSTSSTGPWSRTLPVTIPAGAGTSPPFYYLDTRAGTATLTASAPGATSGTQTVTVTPGPVTSLVVTPGSATVRARGTKQFSAFGVDAYGNRTPVAALWSLTPRTFGLVSPHSGSTATFTALRVLGRGTLNASIRTQAGTISAAAAVNVIPARLRIGTLRFQVVSGNFFLAVRTIDPAGKSVSRARVSIVVRRDGRRYLPKRVTTGAAGRVSLRVPARRGGCFAATVTSVTAAGFVWDGRTPPNRFCRPRRT